MKIKICGIMRHEDIDIVNGALPDYIGFIFYDRSKRYINPIKAVELKKRLDRRIMAVGVFVNVAVDFIVETVHNNTVDIVQLHGDEDAEYIAKLRAEVKETKIIKAVTVNTAEDLEHITDVGADYYLLDNGKGGTGKAFDWSLFPKELSPKVFLAGGVSLENIDTAISLNPYCIDVSSGAKTDGFNDRAKIFELVRRVRNE